MLYNWSVAIYLKILADIPAAMGLGYSKLHLNEWWGEATSMDMIVTAAERAYIGRGWVVGQFICRGEFD